MPPKGKLPESVLKDFELWIKNGAVDPREGGQVVTRSSIDYAKAADFWSFKKPAVTDLPQVRQSDWVKNEVDNYILASLEENHMEPGPRVDKSNAIRRAYYDLIGLPPTPCRLSHSSMTTVLKHFLKWLSHCWLPSITVSVGGGIGWMLLDTAKIRPIHLRRENTHGAICTGIGLSSLLMTTCPTTHSSNTKSLAT